MKTTSRQFILLLALVCATQLLSPTRAEELRVQEFGFGVEFAHPPDAAPEFTGSGCTWIKTGGLPWALTEKYPPAPGHKYDFSKTDAMVSSWQKAGFKNMQMGLRCNAPWAVKSAIKVMAKNVAPVRLPSAAPKDEKLLQCYKEFVQAVAERYDKDGKDDMPGLLYPIKSYQIETDAQDATKWLGSNAEYITLLKAAREGILAAKCQAKVSPFSFNFEDLFDDLPAEAVIEKRMKSSPELVRRYSLVTEVLNHPELYDQLEFQYTSSYPAAYGAVKWLRDEMKKRGAAKPVWADDTLSGPIYFFVNGFRNSLSMNDTLTLCHHLTCEYQPNIPGVYSQWYQEKQAALLIKKLLVSMQLGLGGALVASTHDWDYYRYVPISPLGTATPVPDQVYLRQCSTMGLLAPTAGKPAPKRPAYIAMKCLIEKCKDAIKVSRIATPDGTALFEITRKRPQPLFCAWLDYPKSSPPPTSEPAQTVELKTSATAVPLVFPLTGEEITCATRNGAATVKLNQVPVFIEGAKITGIVRAKSP